MPLHLFPAFLPQHLLNLLPLVHRVPLLEGAVEVTEAGVGVEGGDVVEVTVVLAGRGEVLQDGRLARLVLPEEQQLGDGVAGYEEE
jgi:hypothetical protein